MSSAIGVPEGNVYLMFVYLILIELLLYANHLPSVGDIALNKIDRNPALRMLRLRLGTLLLT